MDDERRRYYHLTPLGQQVARAEAARMDSLVGLAREKQVL
jgi:DNA-binding MarR family transcriptional regulator